MCCGADSFQAVSEELAKGTCVHREYIVCLRDQCSTGPAPSHSLVLGGYGGMEEEGQKCGGEEQVPEQIRVPQC